MYQEVVCWQPMVVRVERLKKKHFHCSQQSNSLVWQLVMTCFVFLPTVQLVRRQCCPPQTGDRARQSGRCHRCPRGRDPAPESRGSSPAFIHQLPWNHCNHHPCNHCDHPVSVEILVRSAPLLSSMLLQRFCMSLTKIFNAKPKECITGDDNDRWGGEGWSHWLELKCISHENYT